MSAKTEILAKAKLKSGDKVNYYTMDGILEGTVGCPFAKKITPKVWQLWYAVLIPGGKCERVYHATEPELGKR